MVKLVNRFDETPVGRIERVFKELVADGARMFAQWYKLHW